MTVSKRARYEVLRRDNHACRYCGGKAPDVHLTVDHVTPVALGGTDDPGNLVAACRDCNAGKSSTSPDAQLVTDVADADLIWAGAIKRVAAVRAAEREKRDDYAMEFFTWWGTWHSGPDRTHLPLPPNWEVSVWNFYKAGLPIEDLTDAVTIACSNDRVAPDSTWRYMCGVAWRQLADIQEAARAVAQAEAVERDPR